MAELSVIGKRLPRVDAVVKATGSARFADDITIQGMLRGKLLRSPYAHARILNIDTSRAEKLPGVRGIITGKDFPGIKFGFIPQTRDQLPFATEKTRHVGEAVAAVAAVDEEVAEEAIHLIKVDYEVLQPVLTIEEALRDGAPFIHENAKKNTAFSANFHYGDVEKGFLESDCVKELKVKSQRVSHGFIEPHSVLAEWDSAGRVQIQASKQSPYITWRHLCRALNLPLSKVRITNPYIGAGFAGKHDPFDLDFAAIILSRKTGRPVKIVVDITDILGAYRQRHSKDAWIKLGAKKDGTLTAVDCKVYLEGGAYACVGALNLHIFGSSLLAPYRLPNARYEGHRIYTTKSPCGALRGQSAVVARYVFESALSAVADELGIDQLDIRLKNALYDGEKSTNGRVMENFIVRDTIEQLSKLVNWKEKKTQKIPNRGIGFACTTCPSGTRVRGHWASAAAIKIGEDGGVTVIQGGTEVGQGSDTVMAQIAAEVLGLRLEDITVATEDTETSILEEGVYSSRTTVWAGNAVRVAAEDARRQLAEVASRMFEIPAADIVFKDGKVFYKDNPGVFAAFSAVARESDFEHGKPIYGRGSWGAVQTGHTDLQSDGGHFTPGEGASTVSLEVEVDPETGMVKMLDSRAVTDNGQPINPLMLEGQMEGTGLAHYAQAFYEQCIVDSAGQPLNADFCDYFIPTAMEIPSFAMKSIVGENPYGPFGAKGGGESIASAAMATAANAVSAAIGVRMTDLPITPDKVLKAIQDKKK